MVVRGAEEAWIEDLGWATEWGAWGEARRVDEIGGCIVGVMALHMVGTGYVAWGGVVLVMTVRRGDGEVSCVGRVGVRCRQGCGKSV